MGGGWLGDDDGSLMSIDDSGVGGLVVMTAEHKVSNSPRHCVSDITELIHRTHKIK